MSERKHSDNLEQFFKKNLENYSPTPSADFWSGVEASIPAKPPFWSGWVASVGKIIGGAAIVGGLAVAGTIWYNDHQKVEELSALVAEQAAIIKQNKNEDNNEKINSDENAHTGKNSISEALLNAGNMEIKNEIIIEKNDAQTIVENKINKELTETINSNKIYTAKNNKQVGLEKNTVDQGLNSELVAGSKKTGVPENQINLMADVARDNPRNISEFKAMQSLLQKINVLSFPTLTTNTNTLSVQVESNYLKGPQPYPRFSLEGGTSVFLMPMGRLFSGDSLVTGGSGPFFAGGFLVNFELNRSIILQSGFFYKNLNAKSLQINYNSFPFYLRKKFAFGYRKKLELKTGIELNTLVNASTPESNSIQNLNTSFVNWAAAAALVTPIGGKSELIVEPQVGYAVTPVANEKRAWSGGLNLGIRYSLQ
ncbi:MAG: hypothetical protein AAFZ15_30275 [Bacteroidota bacterium]